MKPTQEDYDQLYMASLADRVERESQRRADLPKTGLDPEIDEIPPEI